MQTIEIKSVNLSDRKGVIKRPVPQINLTAQGISGDAHSGPWNRQVSLLGTESIRKFETEAGRTIRFGEFAENLTTEGLELWKTRPLDRFRCGEVVLEVTQIGKECHGSACAIFNEVGNCVMPREGIFARVVQPGILRAGDRMEYIPREMVAHVITLSDRAFRGEYEDRSGPAILKQLENKFQELHQPFHTRYSLIPDDPDQLRSLLSGERNGNTDLVITSGGTGIGPRDFTPDVVKTMLDKEIPGIMEMIRCKYGKDKPAALISRSVAGVMGQTLVFTLPGSVRGSSEYMNEINVILMHLIYMLHGLDIH